MADSDRAAVYRHARREARLIAFAVDGVVLAAAAIPFLAVGALAVLAQSDWLGVDPRAHEWVVGYGIAAAWLLLPAAYSAAGAARRGTIGERLMGIRVLRPDGRRPGAARAITRAALRYPSVLLLGIGLWASLLDPQGRTLHDRLAGTASFERVEPGS